MKHCFGFFNFANKGMKIYICEVATSMENHSTLLCKLTVLICA